MKNIQSINNPYIKELKKLQEKKYRDQQRQFLIEGFHLIEEAKSQKQLQNVLITREEDYVEGVENILVNYSIIEKLAQTKTPQNIIGVCRYFEETKLEGSRFLLLDGIQDPGNAGTIVRSALGFGIDMVILSPDSVDIYNDKFIRSTQGAIFKTKIITKSLLDAIVELKALGVTIIGTSLLGKPLREIEAIDKYALILGNEGRGVRPEIIECTDQNIFIEIDSKLESLNVAIAGSIILYYLQRPDMNIQKRR
ncbi:MAG: RNA methyltransferase [Acholeplasmataceae bacterium]|jgi:TrmH family RNA methyltransferase|nr:RNA methyltransferase [Acholeplasmataceae bacterium]